MKAFLIVCLVAAPAFADGSHRHLDVLVTIGTDQRHYELMLADDVCSRVTQKKADFEDDINMCAHAVGDDVRLDVVWKTRQGERLIELSSRTRLAPRAWVDLDRGDAKLTLALR